MRVYISGPMLGRPENNTPAFVDAANRLALAGHTPINPALLSCAFGEPDKLTDAFAEYYASKHPDYTTHPSPDQFARINLAHSVISADLAALDMCDAILMLPGWHKSTGAKHELGVALKRGLDAVTLEDLEK